MADYVLSNAAVARGLTVYLGTTIGISSAKWRLTVPSFPKGFNEIDIVAVAVVLVITLVICYRLLPHAVPTMKLHSQSQVSYIIINLGFLFLFVFQHQGEFGGQHDSDLAAHIVYSVCDNGGILER